MRIKAIDVFKATLPFRLSFGHSLAARSSSENLVVRVTLDDGTLGFGEGVPREYVTGESVDGAAQFIEQTLAPALMPLDVADVSAAVEELSRIFVDFGLDRKQKGASWCALELAVLDAVANACDRPLAPALAPVLRQSVRYGAVVPFGGRKALFAILAFYKLYGFRTVKIKVGGSLDDDIARLKTARAVMGDKVALRVDANCAWTVDTALKAAEHMRKYAVRSIEQPLPASDIAGLARLTRSLPEQIVVDESLCTLAQADELVAEKACSGFNIRLSKVGGLIAARKMASIARRAGIACHMGAQVGESGILSSAGRIFACLEPEFENYEGSDNAFLLKDDLTTENLTVGPGGIGKLSGGRGLGVSVPSERLTRLSVPCQTAVSGSVCARL